MMFKKTGVKFPLDVIFFDAEHALPKSMFKNWC